MEPVPRRLWILESSMQTQTLILGCDSHRPPPTPMGQSWDKAAEDLPIMCEASFAGCMDVAMALAEVGGYLIC